MTVEDYIQNALKILMGNYKVCEKGRVHHEECDLLEVYWHGFFGWQPLCSTKIGWHIFGKRKLKNEAIIPTEIDRQMKYFDLLNRHKACQQVIQEIVGQHFERFKMKNDSMIVMGYSTIEVYIDMEFYFDMKTLGKK